MKRLAESVYAACDCEREDADGGYGRSALAELPARIVKGKERTAVYETIEALVPYPTKQTIPFSVQPGIGEVLQAVRHDAAFMEMQLFLNGLVQENAVEAEAEAFGAQLRAGLSYVPPENRFIRHWEALTDSYAENWAKLMTRTNGWDRAVGQLGATVYLGTRMNGFTVISSPPGVDWMVFADHVAINVIEHLFPTLSRHVRGLVQIPKTKARMANAAALRCAAVRPNSLPE
jgi:hypothetical protein